MRRRFTRCSSFCFGAALASALTIAGPARSAIDLGALARSGGGVLPNAVGARASTVVELAPGAAAPPGFVRIGATPSGSTIGTLDLGAERLFALATARPELSLAWSPPLRLLLDRADGLTHASSFRNQTGLTGKGVVLGIVDTGVDPTHADLRDANGKTRILWWLDFSRERANLYPDLEDELGCRTDPNDTNGVPCAVLAGSDVDALIADDDPTNDPRDFGGHGTHVASLAGGTGLSNSTPRYVGVAPEASYIIARVARKGGGIYDTDVLKAAKFVFDQSDALGMPAVVNLSLGSDFGGHDGSTPAELGLESLVGSDYPGRAIVVAAGNSAGLYLGSGSGVPDPLGVHTELHVADGATALVPIITPPTSPGVTEGTVYLWLTLRPGDHLKLGVDDRAGTVIAPLEPGKETVVQKDQVQVTVVNGVTSSDGPIPPGSYSAVAIIDGTWSSDEVFALRLEGLASARIWVEGDGALSPETSVGPLLPRAQKEGTINVPASAPDLIAVGATVNRTDWPDYAGETVSLEGLGPPEFAPQDTPAYFSSAGPNALGALKPDLVAPGANVVGAMAADADPRGAGSGGLFDDMGLCDTLGFATDCFVVDDAHAVTGGTSMSAPMVTGAVALLFERDPTLNQAEVKALLQSGARRIQSGSVPEQLGAGALDLERTLEALDEGDLERTPGSGSELLVSESYAHPDPTWPLTGLLELRDDAGEVVDGFDVSRLSLVAGGATTLEPLTRLAPGLWQFAVAAPSGSGGRTLTLAATFDGETVAGVTVPIAVDQADAATLPSARGGCSLVPAGSGAPHGEWAAWCAVFAAFGVARRRRLREPETH
ncbi:MAG TPA: S8 family serine peptidase [Polyangiaceae bacterium]|nr:S8 family serine peptidase [Polyangiaceae bacterium]